MIKHLFSTICNRTSIDKETNSLSIFNIIEQITIFSEPEEPVQLPMHFEIISLWMRSNEKIPCSSTAKYYLCDPQGISKTNVEIMIDLSNNLIGRTIIRVSGIELRGPGIYEFHIEIQQENGDWKQVASIPFLVIYKSPKRKLKSTEKVIPKST